MPTKKTKANIAEISEVKEVKENKATAKKASEKVKVESASKVKTEKKLTKPKVVKEKEVKGKEVKGKKVKDKETKPIETIKKQDSIVSLELSTIVDAMSDKKAKGICSINLKSIGTAICDYFVICNANSTTGVLAIADNIEEQMLVKCHSKVARKQGGENAFWVILDYTDIVVHIFQTEYRDFYRLEDLWADAEKIEYKED